MKRNLWRGLLAAAAIAALGLVPASASATHNASTPIHPGVMTFTAGGQCTSNFVFRDGNGTYLGQSAHCAGTGAATVNNDLDKYNAVTADDIRRVAQKYLTNANRTVVTVVPPQKAATSD